jgi:hypothetical protein
LLLDLLTDPEDGGITFLRNVGKFPSDYTSVTSHKTALFIDTPERTSNLPIYSLHRVSGGARKNIH